MRVRYLCSGDELVPARVAGKHRAGAGLTSGARLLSEALADFIGNRQGSGQPRRFDAEQPRGAMLGRPIDTGSPLAHQDR